MCPARRRLFHSTDGVTGLRKRRARGPVKELAHCDHSGAAWGGRGLRPAPREAASGTPLNLRGPDAALHARNSSPRTASGPEARVDPRASSRYYARTGGRALATVSSARHRALPRAPVSAGSRPPPALRRVSGSTKTGGSLDSTRP
jgi:hypothetical protein